METPKTAISHTGFTARTQPASPPDAEGPVASAIERAAARVPSDWFLWAAVGVAGTAAALQIANKPHRSLFVGQWVPALLLMGLYNKLVKVAESDRT